MSGGRQGGGARSSKGTKSAAGATAGAGAQRRLTSGNYSDAARMLAAGSRNMATVGGQVREQSDDEEHNPEGKERKHSQGEECLDTAESEGEESTSSPEAGPGRSRARAVHRGQPVAGGSGKRNAGSSAETPRRFCRLEAAKRYKSTPPKCMRFRPIF